VLLGSMVLATIVSNWVRVLIIMAVGYTSGIHNVLVTRGHLLFGWVLFALVMSAFAWVAARGTAPVPGTRSAIPDAADRVRCAGFSPPPACCFAMPILARAVPAAAGPPVERLELRLPAAPAGWRGPLAATDGRWRPEFVGAHSEWHAAYQDAAGASVEVLAIGYPSQEQTASS